MQDDNITILIKLFETLKESSNKNEISTQKLIMQQLELVGQIKSLPVEDLKAALKEHSKESANSINECSGVIELKTADIIEMLRTITNKINKLMLIVVVVTSVLAAAYLIVRSVADNRQQVVKQVEELPAEQIEIIESIREILEDHTNLGDDSSDQSEE